MNKITLITGANKGLDRETVRRLLAEGHEVWLAARDTSLGRAAADELGARFVQLDVTDENSVTAAAALVATATGGRLDVLINNAGIAGGRKPAGAIATIASVPSATLCVPLWSGPTGTFVDRNGVVAW